METILVGDEQSRERAYRALAESQKVAGSDCSEMLVSGKIKG